MCFKFKMLCKYRALEFCWLIYGSDLTHPFNADG